MRTRMTTVVTLMVGALVGWIAASGQFKFKLPPSATFASASPASLAAADDPKPAPGSGGQPAKEGKKPNILVIMGDDIGWNNPSCYHRGDMGYWTPNIDRIAKEGAMFTSWYGQQSCTAGRAAFITGRS